MPEKLVSFRMHREATSRKNAKIPIAFHDEIVLGWLLLESKYYEVFRKNMCRDKKLVQIRQRYKTFLKKYIRLLGYFSLLEIMPGYGFSNYLEGFKPGFIDHLRYRFRRPKNS
jgi:hypothetical protein